MAYRLQNDKIEIQVDHPNEGYGFNRFDHTGKITSVKYQGIPVATSERKDLPNSTLFGKGFYNEFGIECPPGFETTPIGGVFHKIGVGMLTKTSKTYAFHEEYPYKPLEFKVSYSNPNTLIIACEGPECAGYAYGLTKRIALETSGFSIHYELFNRGKKNIQTDEYVHNFIGLNTGLINQDYEIRFPFVLQPKMFEETVNPEEKVLMHNNKVTFKATPNLPFFFSRLSGGKAVKSEWQVKHHHLGLGMREVGNFQTDKINLWGWQHVVSPELFYKINLSPGAKLRWTRQYEIFEIDPS